MEDISGNIDQRLLQAYLSTIYGVQHLGLFIQIGQENHFLDEFLVDNNVFTWAFISAWNPRSIPLSDLENSKRQEEFVKIVENKGYRFAEGQGTPADENWEAEKSLLILDIPKKEAVALAQHFEQNAIVFGQLGGLPTLVITALD